MSANSRLTTAVHALCWLELSRRRGAPVLSSARVAASLDSHPVLVRRCLGELKAAGLVTSSRGPGAGWSLAKPAETITMRDVHLALEDRDIFALHAHEPNQDCPVGYGIRPVLSDVYRDVERIVEDRLSSETIATLLDRTLSIAAPLAR